MDLKERIRENLLLLMESAEKDIDRIAASKALMQLEGLVTKQIDAHVEVTKSELSELLDELHEHNN